MQKKDILELKRRFKKDACTFTKMRGCYVDSQKNILLHIDETFLNLEEEEFYKYLEIAKKALSGTIGNNLLELSFRRDDEGNEAQRFFLALRDSGLKGDGLLDLLYERIIREYDFAGNYLILLFHDAYDVITKTTDNNKLDESEEVYEYILCAICPVELTKAGLGYHKDKNVIAPRIRDWVVSVPETGFLFPAFSDRSSDVNALGYYVKDAKKAQPEFMQEALGCEPKRTAAEEKKTFHGILKDVISEEMEDAKNVILDIQQDLNDMVEEHKNVFENEPVLLTPPAIREAMAEKGLSEEVISKVEEICEETFGDTPPLAENLIDSKALQTRAAAKKAEVLALEVESLKQKLEEKEALPEKEVILQVSAEKLPAIQREQINGKTCIVIPLEEDERATINGKQWEDAPF
nr:DUF4317 domain-containing protein [uncultured Anaerotignum sp.]